MDLGLQWVEVLEQLFLGMERGMEWGLALGLGKVEGLEKFREMVLGTEWDLEIPLVEARATE